MADANDAPILEFDPSPSAVFEPHHVITRGDEVPARAVLCFFSQVIDRLAERGAEVLFELQAAHGVHPVYAFDELGERIAVFHPGVGAPLAAGFFEESIAHGCERFIAVGTAGALVPDVTVGHVVVPTSAVRDEGTSYHYQPASRTSEPAPEGVKAVTTALERHGVPFVTGATWTTDGFYRETRAKVERRVAEGCLTVEMEAAALFAVAAFRQVPIGMVLTASDSLSGEDWTGFTNEHDHDLRWRLFEMAAEAVLEL
jgi:uridine phosphorylase